MDHFTLEALPARYGDCLLLHYGSDEKPGLILIDGGPGKVWEKSLQPRHVGLPRLALFQLLEALIKLFTAFLQPVFFTVQVGTAAV